MRRHAAFGVAMKAHQRKQTTGLVSRAALLMALSVGLYGCTGGLGCGGDGGGCINAYPYPSSGLSNGVVPVDDGARMRMTQAGLDFLQENLKEILIGALGSDPQDPDTIRIQIADPIDVGIGTLGVGDAETYPTSIFIDARDLSDRMQFEFIQGANDGIHARVDDIPIGLDARVFSEVDLGLTTATAACDVDGTNDSYCTPDNPRYPNCQMLTTLGFDVSIYPDVGTGAQCDAGVAECLLLDVQIASVSIGDFGAGAIEISEPSRCNVSNPAPDCSPECSDTFPITDPSGDAECDILCFIEDLAVDLAAGLGGILLPILEPFLDNLLEAAIRNALADFDGAPVAAADRLDLAGITEGLLNPSGHDLGYLVAPTGDAFDVNCPAGVNCEQTKGMDFIFKTGFEAAPPLPEEGDPMPVPHPCVEQIAGAEFAALYGGQGEFVASDAEPLSGQYEGAPYHLGASLAKSSLNQALYAMYNAGIFCIELDSDDVHVLAGGAFPLSAGTLDLLTEGKLRQFAEPSAPAVVSVIPSEPPIMSYGVGDETEGHIIATWKDVIVSFYVQVYDRPARVFAVEADISAQLSVFVDPDTSTLQVAVVEGPTIDGFVETYNELLPGVAFDEVLASLISLAFDSLLGDDLGLDYDVAGILASALGVPIYVDFRGLETVPPTGEREFLNVYLALSSVAPQPFTEPLVTQLRIAEEPGLFVLEELDELRAKKLPTGTLRLVGQWQHLPDDHEYFVQLDGGTWRGPLRPFEGDLLIEDAKLKLVGQHTLRLRARRIGEPTSLVQADGELRFWVDPQKPWADLVVNGGVLEASATDVGTLPEDLVYAWAFDGEWGEYDDVRSMDLEDLEDVRRVSVRVRDLAGNVSNPVTVDLGSARALEERRTDRLEPGLLGPMTQGGCSSAGGASSALLGALALLLLLRRRRR
jgi:MYXO-CTERM domain-containing protein